MRKIYIGDVHGCLVELEELLDKLCLDERDEVIFVGDLLDKGPYGPTCVDLVRCGKYKCVLGNHEDKHNRFAKHRFRELTEPGYENPMSPRPEFIKEHLGLPQACIQWMSNLEPIFQEGQWVVVHGGLFPGIPLGEQASNKKLRGSILRLRWLNEDNKHVPVDYENITKGPPEGCRHWAEVYDGPYNVVYGHEAHHLNEPKIDYGMYKNMCFGIDTGCVHGGHLTALTLTGNDWDFVQVKARKKYAEPPIPIPG
jgi:hypothetical protein